MHCTHRRLVTLESELSSKKKQLVKTQSDLEKVSTLTEKLSQEVKESNGHVEEAKSSMAAQNERGQVLTALLRQRDTGALPGICGRLVSGCEGEYCIAEGHWGTAWDLWEAGKWVRVSTV